MNENTEDSWHRFVSPGNIFGVAIGLLFAVLIYVQIVKTSSSSPTVSTSRRHSERAVSNVTKDDFQSWINQDREHGHFLGKTADQSPDESREGTELRSLTTEWRAIPSEVRRGLKAIDIDTSVPVVTTSDFHLPSIDGETVGLRDVRGKWVLVNFWASWCGPCRQEMPALETLSEDLPTEHFKLLTINVRESRDTVEDYLRSESLSIPVLLDSQGKVTERYHVRALPVSWLFAPDGHPVGRFLGIRHWSRSPVREVFKDLASPPD